MGSEWFGMFIVWVAAGALSLGVIWLVIYSSVLSAIRAAKKEPTPVSIASSIALKVQLPREQVAQLRGDEDGASSAATSSAS